jgi:hypothetical protein
VFNNQFLEDTQQNNQFPRPPISIGNNVSFGTRTQDTIRAAAMPIKIPNEEEKEIDVPEPRQMAHLGDLPVPRNYLISITDFRINRNPDTSESRSYKHALTKREHFRSFGIRSFYLPPRIDLTIPRL